MPPRGGGTHSHDPTLILLCLRSLSSSGEKGHPWKYEEKKHVANTTRPSEPGPLRATSLRAGEAEPEGPKWSSSHLLAEHRTPPCWEKTSLVTDLISLVTGKESQVEKDFVCFNVIKVYSGSLENQTNRKTKTNKLSSEMTSGLLESRGTFILLIWDRRPCSGETWEALHTPEGTGLSQEAAYCWGRRTGCEV